MNGFSSLLQCSVPLNFVLFYILAYSWDGYVSVPHFTYAFENSASDSLIKEIYFVSLNFWFVSRPYYLLGKWLDVVYVVRTQIIWFSLKMDQIFIYFKYNSGMERILFMAYQRNNLPSWFLFFAQFILLIHYSQIFAWQ